MSRYLFVVAREHPDLWSHLSREFSGEAGVEVVLDRRREERRHGVQFRPSERRRQDRRARPSINHELSSMNFALIPSE